MRHYNPILHGSPRAWAESSMHFKGPSGGGTATTYTSNVPKGMEKEFAKLYDIAQEQAFQIDAEGNIVGFAPYVPYSADPADYVAGFSPMQEQSFQSAANLAVPGQFGQATDLAQAAGTGGLGSAQQAYDYGAQGAQSGMLGQNVGLTGGQAYGGLGAQYGAQGAGYGDLSAQIGQMGLQAQATGQGITKQSQDYAAQQAAAGQVYQDLATNPAAVQAYMSPYVSAVIDNQKSAAIRDYNVQKANRQAVAAKSGAYGGARQAIEEAEASRNLNTQLQGLEAAGLQDAYKNAISSMQYGTSLGTQGLSGAQAGLGTALQGGQLGLSGIGTALQGLQGGMQGAGIGIQGAQTGLEGVQTQLQGTAQGMQGAQVGLQGVSGAQAGYGLANQAGANLANIGTQQNQAAMDIIALQNQLGAQQQQQQQNITNQAIQDYATAQQWPQMQVQNLSNILHGAVGQGSTTQQYQAPSVAGQLAGLGTAAYGLSQLGNKAEGGIVKLAKGGMVQKYADGGDVMSVDNVERIAQDLPIQQLQQAIKNKTVPEYIGIPLLAQKQQEQQRVAMAQAAQQAQQGLPTIKDRVMQGVEALPSNLYAGEGQDTFSAAQGGIVAFAKGDYVFNPETNWEEEQLKAKRVREIKDLQARNPRMQLPETPTVATPFDAAMRYYLGNDVNLENVGPFHGPAMNSLAQRRKAWLAGETEPGVTPAAQPEVKPADVSQTKPGALTGTRIKEPTPPVFPVGGYGGTDLYSKFEKALQPAEAELTKLENYESPYAKDVANAAKALQTRALEPQMTRAQAEAEAAKMYPGEAYADYETSIKEDLSKLSQREKDATAKGWIKAGMSMIEASMPKPGEPSPSLFSIFAKGATTGIDYTEGEQKEIDKARQLHNRSMADVVQARRLEAQGKAKEAQRLYDRSEDKRTQAEDKVFEVYKGLNTEAQNRFRAIIAGRVEMHTAKAKGLSDIGQAEMSQAGADRRAKANLDLEKYLYGGGLKGGSKETGGWTNQQIAEMQETLRPEATKLVMESPAIQRMGAEQRKLKQADIDKAIQQKLSELVQAKMGAVRTARYGQAAELPYASIP